MRTAATFGRFRVFHLGHYQMIARMVRENERVIVGISGHSTSQRSAEVIMHFFPNVEVVYSSTLFTLCQDYPLIDHIYLGADQAQLGTSIIRYHQSDLTLINRPDDSPSSTLCRELYHLNSGCQEFINVGLAINTIHALLIISQCHMESLNG